MNKKTTLIVIVIAVLALGGIGTAIALNMNKKDATDSSKSTPSNETNNTVDASKTFNPQDLSKLSYIATSKATVSGQTVTSTIESNGKGTTKSSSTAAGITTDTYTTGTDVIVCINSECTKTALGPNDDAAANGAKELAQYRETATYSGSESIDGQSYNVWKASGPAGDMTYYIDSQNRIGRIALGSSTTTVYDYKDVTITVPTV